MEYYTIFKVQKIFFLLIYIKRTCSGIFAAQPKVGVTKERPSNKEFTFGPLEKVHEHLKKVLKL